MKTPPANPAQPALAFAQETVGFRLDAASRRRLAERAAALGLSPHELARHYVLERLEQATALAELMQGLQAVYHELRESRIDVALGVEALLSRAGRVGDAEARAWVKKNYAAACSPSPPP